jgi:flagellar export protein FliJ
MKRFKFSLESVHKVREVRQERESVILGELRAEAMRAAERVANIEMMRREAIDRYARRLTNGERVDAMEMELSSKHFASLDRLQKEAEAELAKRNRDCDLQVAAVTEAMRNVKITENLRDTQFERHRAEFDRQQQSNIDEIVTTSFVRRSMGEK